MCSPICGCFMSVAQLVGLRCAGAAGDFPKEILRRPPLTEMVKFGFASPTL